MEYGLWPNCSRVKEEQLSLNPCSNGIWSLTKRRLPSRILKSGVLILVLMEYGLWRMLINLSINYLTVLILVLMEYGLWQSLTGNAITVSDVLILVLMEYGLWLAWAIKQWFPRQVLSLVLMEYGLWLGFVIETFWGYEGLNPCSNGIWSLTTRNFFKANALLRVLILVLMEYGLWQIDNPEEEIQALVLILVLMEYGLWLISQFIFIHLS